ncbi:MAG: nucleotide exchange factor GrpE [Anaerolineales bacterium]
MSSKKMNQPKAGAEEIPEDSMEQQSDAATEATAQVAPGISAMAELKKSLAEVQSQAAEYKEGWQRSVADFQNYRRRMEAEKAETYQLAVCNVLKRYLPVLDDMERAMDSRPADLAWANGIELICRKLESILEAEGLKRIEAEGQKFDPNFHEAISQEPAEGVESGTVIAVVRNGYMLGEHVIRPAMVRVAQ